MSETRDETRGHPVPEETGPFVPHGRFRPTPDNPTPLLEQDTAEDLFSDDVGDLVGEDALTDLEEQPTNLVED